MGMEDAPGADDCMTDSNLNDDFKVGLGESINVDKDGVYDDTT
jgi:hypothetical protein